MLINFGPFASSINEPCLVPTKMRDAQKPHSREEEIQHLDRTIVVFYPSVVHLKVLEPPSPLCLALKCT